MMYKSKFRKIDPYDWFVVQGHIYEWIVFPNLKCYQNKNVLLWSNLHNKITNMY